MNNRQLRDLVNLKILSQINRLGLIIEVSPVFFKNLTHPGFLA